jgi:hypothetical protein
MVRSGMLCVVGSIDPLASWDCPIGKEKAKESRKLSGNEEYVYNKRMQMISLGLCGGKTGK